MLIKIAAASINPIDWKQRAGYMKDIFPLTFPATLGWDVSGTVEEAGENVTHFRPGDQVYALLEGGGYGCWIEGRWDQLPIGLCPYSRQGIPARAVLRMVLVWKR